MTTESRRAAAGMAAALFAAGCGGLVRVEGTVRVDGKPVERGTLVFLVPEGDTRKAEALVQDDGYFLLRTDNQVGVMPGEYRVTLSNSVNSIEAPWQADPQNFNDPAWAAYEKKLEKLRTRPPEPGVLPHTYALATTSPLRWRVPGDGRRMDLDLPSGAK